MAKSLNEWKGIGNITRDIDVRYTPSGSAIANFSIACNDSYKDKNSGEQVDATEFVNIVAFGKLAEIIGEYMKKGSKIYISGKLTTSKYEKEGQTHYSTKIKAEDMLMLDSRDSAPSNYSQPQANRNQEDAPQESQRNNPFDDDIPFMPYEYKAIV